MNVIAIIPRIDPSKIKVSFSASMHYDQYDSNGEPVFTGAKITAEESEEIEF